ncbi:MAG: polysaccharide export protein [Sphingobacteriaceae bacterium]|nr:MAG: polysaccharide export protein [Sphingobacteriaceae bacterium]
MIKKNKGIFQPTHLILCLFIISALCSCTVNKKIKYFQDLPDSAKYGAINTVPFKGPVIQKDDIISLDIQTIDPGNTAVLNQGTSVQSVGSSSASAIGTQQISGFLVDKDGNIEVPLLGKIMVAGLTTSEARELIRTKAAVYYKNPSVQVRFANFKITLIGEVAKPATYTVPNEKVSILDAIGLAGDLTIFGRRENVLLIRDIDGQKKYARIDLNSSETFSSPYFYLKQNDVIYVEPNKAKITSTDATKTRNITIAASLFSALLVVLIRVL